MRLSSKSHLFWCCISTSKQIRVSGNCSCWYTCPICCVCQSQELSFVHRIIFKDLYPIIIASYFIVLLSLEVYFIAGVGGWLLHSERYLSKRKHFGHFRFEVFTDLVVSFFDKERCLFPLFIEGWWWKQWSLQQCFGSRKIQRQLKTTEKRGRRYKQTSSRRNPHIKLFRQIRFWGKIGEIAFSNILCKKFTASIPPLVWVVPSLTDWFSCFTFAIKCSARLLSSFQQ